MLGTFLFLLILGIAIFHNVATAHYIYWNFRWSDMVVHFFGGLWIALTSFWVCRFWIQGGNREYTLMEIVFVTVGVAFLVGVLWEVFEFSMDIVSYSSLYVADTISDILMDVLGSIFALYVVLKLENRTIKENNKIEQ